MNDFYLGRWSWGSVNPAGPREGWMPPVDRAAGSLDLRCLTDMAQKGGAPLGYGIFAYDRQIDRADMVHLGDDPLGLVNDKTRDALHQSLVPVAPTRQARLCDLLWELMTGDSTDPTGQARWKCLMPATDLQQNLYLGGLIRGSHVGVGCREWDAIQRQLRAGYAACKVEVDAGRVAPDTHRKLLGSLCRQWKVSDPSIFVPIGAAVPDPKEPATTFAESFNKANSDTLGPDLNWTELAGDWDVVSNAAQVGADFIDNFARADHDLSSSDIYAQWALASLHEGASEIGALARMQSTGALTFYGASWFRASSANTFISFKFIAGAYTHLGSDTGGSGGVNDSLKVTVQGSSLTRSLNGATQDGPITDTSITTGVRGGLFGYSNGVPGSIDLFETGDLAAPEKVPFNQQSVRVQPLLVR